MTVVSSAGTLCCVVTTPVATTPVAMLHVAVAPERLGATSYMEPMFGLCWSMLGSWRLLSLCWAKNGVFLFNPLPGPKGTLRFWIMSGPCWAYMEPMLGLCWSMSVRLLEAILGPYLSHVELMLSQERRVPFKSSNFEGATRWKFAAVGYRFPPRSGFSRVS